MATGGSERAELDAVRSRIDAIDQELLRLISERARCAQQVAHIKIGTEGRAVQFYRPEREVAVLRRIKAANPGPLDGEEVARLFREIMSACLALERPLNAAFLGPEGTFTQAAAIKHFGHSVVTKAMATIDEIFREVEVGRLRLRRRAGGEFDRGRDQPHAGPLHELAAADHRRGQPADPSSSA